MRVCPSVCCLLLSLTLLFRCFVIVFAVVVVFVFVFFVRMHEFLDRFGLINTRTGGKRPPSYPVTPPSMHLWNPTPPASPPSRALKAAGDARREKQAGRPAAAATAVVAAAARGAAARRGGGERERGASRGWGAQACRVAPAAVEKAWPRQELTRLMEAALAHPYQWELVAQQVWRPLGRRAVGAVWERRQGMGAEGGGGVYTYRRF